MIWACFVATGLENLAVIESTTNSSVYQSIQLNVNIMGEKDKNEDVSVQVTSRFRKLKEHEKLR